MHRKFLSVLSSAFMVTAVCGNFDFTEIYAAESYPVQEFILGIADTDRNMNVSGTLLKSDVFNGTDSEKVSRLGLKVRAFEVSSLLTIL